MQPHCEKSCFDNLIIIQDIFQEKSQNICWFQLLRSEALLLLFNIHDNKLQINEFWIVDPTKYDSLLT